MFIYLHKIRHKIEFWLKTVLFLYDLLEVVFK